MRKILTIGVVRGNERWLYYRDGRINEVVVWWGSTVPQRRDIQRGNTRQIVSRRYIQSINYRKLY
jgi:hypothetical protein